ncbi:imidazole glycerol phosphate synthase cyclase subunit [Candidatus Pelagibacter sp. Uisw_121]|uniref:imidazole glycerol phosphate synthase subunit HisF n=1 Tax=Candidatus Pelagibacter sp. Uisw_121 TaxID=3230987 RepID=UPI0039E9103D
MNKIIQKIRIIPKLEIKNNHLIKGVKFEGLRKIGDPVLFAKKYYDEGADQINIIDIVASLYDRDNLFEIVDKITNNIFIPINVGGGIKNIEDIKKLLNVGADRIIINSEALRNINFIKELKNIFGDQFISISIEAKKINNNYYCMMDHGRENSNIKLKDWIIELNKLNVGEVIVNSIDNDGMENGFEDDLISEVHDKINCPIVISGGASKVEDFYEAIKNYKIDGLCLSSALHFGKIKINEIKKYLLEKEITVNFK